MKRLTIGPLPSRRTLSILTACVKQYGKTLLLKVISFVRRYKHEDEAAVKAGTKEPAMMSTKMGDLEYDQGMLSLKFKAFDKREADNKRCPSASGSFGEINAQVRFVCPHEDYKRINTTQAKVDELSLLNVKSEGCDITYWFTAWEACPPTSTPTCKIAAGGKKYDLTSLRRTDSQDPWSAFQQKADTFPAENEYQYFIDVCSPLPSSKLPDA